MEIAGKNILLRPWRSGDEGSLVRYANNRKIWVHLRDRFPYPYTRKDAREWIRSTRRRTGPPLHFAIDVLGEAVGGAGLEPGSDVHRLAAEVGYWLGEPFWGRGLATEATRYLTEYAFEQFDYERLQAIVFESNPASCRVLEKAGYELEARMKRSIFKDGKLMDCFLYVRLREDSV